VVTHELLDKPVAEAKAMLLHQTVNFGELWFRCGTRRVENGITASERREEASHIDGRHVDHGGSVQYLIADRTRRLVDVDGADDEQIGRQRHLCADAGA